jgi:hypothetical protein
MFSGIKPSNPDTTAIFVQPYTFYGYRQIMYYLPEYRVYQVDVRITPTGAVRKTFWGKKKKTFLTDEITISEQIHEFIMPIFLSDMKKILTRNELATRELLNDLFIVSGPIHLIKEIYPELNIRIPNNSNVGKNEREQR